MVNPYLMHRRKAFRGGSAWSPAQLSLARWFTMEASTLFNATSGGSTPSADGAVLRIEDISGNARHATQATSGSCAIRKVTSLNGRDSIRFDGSNDIYTSTGGAYASRWAIAVCRFDQAGAKAWAGLYTGSTTQLNLNGTGDNLFTTTGFTVRRDGTATTTFARQTNFIWFCDIGGTPSPLEAKTFGAEHNAPAGRYWIGDCWELIEGDQLLTLADTQRLEGYLAHRYGLTANLPSGHPYKAARPL